MGNKEQPLSFAISRDPFALNPSASTRMVATRRHEDYSEPKTPVSPLSNGTEEMESEGDFGPWRSAVTRRRLLWAALVFIYIVAMISLSTFSVSETSPAEEPPKAVPFQRIWKNTKNLLQNAQTLLEQASPQVSHPATTTTKKPKQSEFPRAFTTEPKLKGKDRDILVEFSQRVHQLIPDVHHRAAAVPWGGPHHGMKWWSPVGNHTHARHHDLDKLDGAYLLHSYHSIMRLYMKDPYNLTHTSFPFRLCKSNHCAVEGTIAHTLEWREKFQPWCVTPSVMDENKNGFVYARGMALPSSDNYGRHAMVWARPGVVTRVKEPLGYCRAILQTLDRAVADSLHDSHGRLGGVNVVVDATDYEWRKMPDLAHIKQTVVMLQDHFPRKLGMVFLANLSRTAELFVNLVKPLITKEVREKIHVLPHDKDKLIAQLEAIVDKHHIPDWLGGFDTYKFDAESYYPKRLLCSEEEGRKYLITMPYHAH